MKNKVSFNNVDRKGEKKKKPRLGEETWITMQFKTTYCEGEIYIPRDRGPQNTATRNLGSIHHLIKVLGICKYLN